MGHTSTNWCGGLILYSVTVDCNWLEQTRTEHCCVTMGRCFPLPMKPHFTQKGDAFVIHTNLFLLLLLLLLIFFFTVPFSFFFALPKCYFSCLFVGVFFFLLSPSLINTYTLKKKKIWLSNMKVEYIDLWIKHSFSGFNIFTAIELLLVSSWHWPSTRSSAMFTI